MKTDVNRDCQKTLVNGEKPIASSRTKSKKRKLKLRNIKANTITAGSEMVKKEKLQDSKTKEILESIIQEGGFAKWKKEDVTDSSFIGSQTFNRLINPTGSKTFFKNYWEKSPLLIKRSYPLYYGDLLSTKDLHNMFKNRNVQFGKNVDVTAYINGKRETKELDGRAYPSRVWDMYNSGCSIRLLNPQTFHEPVWRMLANLQEYFGSFCGANVYLTPPGTQGFAPHWDDIEAFILQLEGKKHWRVYKPRCKDETLPRKSSHNFGPHDDLGTPVIDTVLNAGDMLYFPRGFIHQGNALSDSHSLHITISTYQNTSWMDYFEKLIPACLKSVSESELSLREGLPIGYLNEMGIVHSDKESDFRKNFINKVKQHMNKILDESLIDGAADQMAKEFIYSALPPAPSEDEQSKSVFNGGEVWSSRKGRVNNIVELTPDTPVRLLKRNCVRLVSEEDTQFLYYTIDNSREYRAEQVKRLEIEDDYPIAIEKLIETYPDYILPEDLPCGDNLKDLETKMLLVNSLWERGILTTEDVLDPTYD